MPFLAPLAPLSMWGCPKRDRWVVATRLLAIQTLDNGQPQQRPQLADALIKTCVALSVSHAFNFKGHRKPFFYVEFATSFEATKANLKLHDQLIDGNKVEVLVRSRCVKTVVKCYLERERDEKDLKNDEKLPHTVTNRVNRRQCWLGVGIYTFQHCIMIRGRLSETFVRQYWLSS